MAHIAGDGSDFVTYAMSLNQNRPDLHSLNIKEYSRDRHSARYRGHEMHPLAQRRQIAGRGANTAFPQNGDAGCIDNLQRESSRRHGNQRMRKERQPPRI